MVPTVQKGRHAQLDAPPFKLWSKGGQMLEKLKWLTMHLPNAATLGHLHKTLLQQLPIKHTL